MKQKMTEHKFTDEEVIKALECCEKCDRCHECPYDKLPEKCRTNLLRDSLDLINRQKAEIERLSDRNKKCIYLSDEETTEYCVDAVCPNFKTYEELIRAEAIKEFAERLKAEACYFCRAVAVEDIDKIVEELTETGDNNEQKEN